MNFSSLLSEYNDSKGVNTNLSTAALVQQSEMDTRQHLQQIYAARNSTGRGAAVGSIPRFHLSSSSNGDYAARIRDVTNERFVNYKMKHLLDSDELEQLIVIMRENLSPPFETEETVAPLPYNPMRPTPTPVPATPPCEGLNYDAFTRVGSYFPRKTAPLFSASTFLQFRRDKHGRLSISEFFEYVCRHRDLSEERINLSLFDPTGDGYMREIHLENYFYDFIQHIPSLVALQEDFTHFYVFTAVRRFFFFLDRHGKRKLAIKEILVSPVFRELQELRQSEWDEELPRCQENWFSAHSSLRVYREYLELDQDQNGMLCKNELKLYNSSSLTNLFIERIWQEYRTYKNEETGLYEMDYKQFLDFTLAMENQKTPQSLQWFWKILDINKLGYIDLNIIKMFFNQVLTEIVSEHHQTVEVNCLDVCDEIFDMAKPVHPCRITLKDLIECGVGDTIVSMMVDVSEFLSYDGGDGGGT